MKKLYILLCLMASINAFSQNLISTSSWEAGAKNAPIGFANIGSPKENSRELGTDPHGDESVLWMATPDGNKSFDGGFRSTSIVTVDPIKTYRISAWVKKTTSNEGSCWVASTVSDAKNRSALVDLTGKATNLSHFWFGTPPALDHWFLVVGFIHKSDYTSEVMLGGVYDGKTGTKLLENKNEYKFSAEATKIAIRTFLHSETNKLGRAFFYNPRIEVVNGKEPSIADLVAGKKPNGNGGGNTGGKGSWTSSGENIYYNAPGNVGIGTDAPSEKLDVAGNVSVKGDVLSNGRIAIGTTAADPGYRLTVKGKIHVQEVKIDLKGVIAPDYVFDNSYDLKTLAQVRDFIDKEGHLPNIPSAEEMEENGINLKEMNMKLLEKIEELTLHAISQSEEIQRHKQAYEQLEKRLKRLENNQPKN